MSATGMRGECAVASNIRARMIMLRPYHFTIVDTAKRELSLAIMHG